MQTQPAAIVGIGHDLQLVHELEGREALCERDVVFGALELSKAVNGPSPLRALATLFSVKEAFFKAIPVQSGWFWCELELQRDERGRPHFGFTGALAELMETHHWSAQVSISHCGPYVSTVVLLQAS
jgi:holo-[acyl-carrier protein] synthase